MNVLNNMCRILVVILALCIFTGAVSAATTEITIEKYTADGVLLNSTTVNYQWMESNLPVVGNGYTHYYLQGPVFEGDLWDPTELVNVETKDMGALKGAAVKDLYELVGGRLMVMELPSSRLTGSKRSSRRNTSTILNLLWVQSFFPGTAEMMGMSRSITQECV